MLRFLYIFGLFTAAVAASCDNEPWCPETQAYCWARCVDLSNDEDNCGECGNQCGSHTECVNGECVCAAGYTDCSGQCVNLHYDSNNCGACGNTCEAPKTCKNGVCSSGCKDLGLIICGTVCVDPMNDADHCGECFNACGVNQECMNGQCVDVCECHEDADCMPGYCCMNCMCFPKGCEGKCCGEDRCGGTCPDECAAGEICDVSTCTCEEHGDVGDPCPYQDIHLDVPGCRPGTICIGIEDSGDVCPSGADDECPYSWYNPVCVGGSCKYSMCYLECDLDFDEYPCGCPTGYAMHEFEYEQELVCVCWYDEQSGTQGPGEPCPFGDVNTNHDYCGKYDECNWMICLGNDSTDGTCPGGSATECTEIPESHNPDCVNGTCGFSFCAPPCVDGACDDGFEPEDISGTCYCIPLP